MNLPSSLRKLARRGVTFSHALLKDCNLLSRRQPEAVLAPVSYRSSSRRRHRKRLLLKVPIAGSFLGTMFLIVVDAHSKLPEVILMTTSAARTIGDYARLFTAEV